VGPFLSIYLKSVLNWDTGKTGMALAAMSIAGAIMQLPSGLLVDSTKFKRLILAVSCVLISLGCLIIGVFPFLMSVILAQSMIGVASAIIPPSITAITIGLVKRKAFPKRISINESWNHAGNLFTALLAGGISAVFEILSDLSEYLNIENCTKVIPHLKKAPALQRLGYFLELLGLAEQAQLCKKELKKHSYVKKVLLDPHEKSEGALLNARWNLIINIELEIEHDT
jgi:MFS family permease